MVVSVRTIGMNRETLLKFLQFFFIVFVGIAADQWTKYYAESRLATTRNGHFSQHIVLEVPQSANGKTVKEYLTSEFTYNTEKEIDTMTRIYTKTPEGIRMRARDKVKTGQKVHITRREVVVIKDYWDFQYTRNPGAAFGFLADSKSELRRPFFIVISIIAMLIILYILKGVMLSQQILIWGLSLIAGGAVGNFIDRIRFGYVIDFILWKYTDAHRWPTFNVADALICVGVAFMFIEIVRDGLAQRKANQEGGGEDDEEDKPAEATA